MAVNKVGLVRWAVNLEGIRRIGEAMYLFRILLGLATIIRVPRFQAIRIREIASV